MTQRTVRPRRRLAHAVDALRERGLIVAAAVPAAAEPIPPAVRNQAISAIERLRRGGIATRMAAQQLSRLVESDNRHGDLCQILSSLRQAEEHVKALLEEEERL